MPIVITVNPRDGSASGNGCNTCCCELVKLRIGEVSKLILNYAPWSVPLRGRGLHCQPDIEVSVNTQACPNDSVESGAPPQNVNIFLQTAINTPADGDMSENATPGDSLFKYEKYPLTVS